MRTPLIFYRILYIVRKQEVAVILSIEDYKKISSPKKTLYEFIQTSPLRDLRLELPERLPEKMRETDIFPSGLLRLRSQ